MTKKAIAGAISLLVIGAVGGAIALSYLNSREKQFKRNTDIAYENAERQLKAGPPSVDPFAKEHEAYEAFEEECEFGAQTILHYTSGPDKDKPFQRFKLAGFIPAFDNYRIAVYTVITASERQLFVGCMGSYEFDFKGTRFLKYPSAY